MSSPSPEDAARSRLRTKIVLGVMALACCCGGLLAALVPAGSVIALGKKDFQAQCDIALGTSPGATPTSTTSPSPTSPSTSTSDAPIANPYAALKIDPDDPDFTERDRKCASAMRLAPRQDQPLSRPNTGAAATCAADLALRYPEAGGTAQMADYVRDVVYSASAFAATRRCEPTRAPGAVAEESCGDPTKRAPAVVLPETVAEQAYCGKLVDPAAASPGDLVFWEYRDDAATRAGVALSPDELVTVDGGKFVRLTIPDGAEIQIKRVLGEDS
ncbi:hypothetical protein [Nocardia sp. NPDC019395]|uniref:hypothetical protein n=1 Tax=Nocardia sp. NPDC019395 TaxID=3154686 RepID=UPI0033D686F3